MGNIKKHNPVFSKEGCYSCWYCKECGITGCENRANYDVNSLNLPSSLESECPGRTTIGRAITSLDFSKMMISGDTNSLKAFTTMKENKKIINKEIDYAHIENPVIKPFLVIANEGYYPEFGTGDWIAAYETIEEANAAADSISKTSDKFITIVDLRKWMYWRK